MSLETEHRRHHTEPTPHPDEPQPIKWTGRRAEPWTIKRRALDDMYKNATQNFSTGKRRADYRKPRTITTAEDLDALPRGSVVLSAVYIAHHGMAISFQRWEDGLWHRGARSSDTHPDNFLPVTVLWEPAP